MLSMRACERSIRLKHNENIGIRENLQIYFAHSKSMTKCEIYNVKYEAHAIGDSFNSGRYFTLMSLDSPTIV